MAASSAARRGVPPERAPGLPRGVSKTLSGRYQARIVLHGKRIDLGSFLSPEEAAAAYNEAKVKGTTERPSPCKGRARPGTGMFLCIHPNHTLTERFGC